jgi:hypothetical protein
MIELLAYLRAHGFKTFIVSGGGIEFMRPWVEKAYGIPPQESLRLRYLLPRRASILGSDNVFLREFFGITSTSSQWTLGINLGFLQRCSKFPPVFLSIYVKAIGNARTND